MTTLLPDYGRDYTRYTLLSSQLNGAIHDLRIASAVTQDNDLSLLFVDSFCQRDIGFEG